MNNLVMKEVDFYGDVLVAGQNKDNEKIYVGVSWICNGLGFTKSQKDSQVQKIQTDLVLKQGVKFLNIKTKGGEQDSLHLEMKYLPIWLSKINTKSLNDEQYKKLISLLNWTLSDEFNELKVPSSTYNWEGELRDEIYNSGYFNEYKLIDKEIVYDFGRIDLLAKDGNDILVVIELKKNKNYNDVIEQCKNYVEGFKKDFNEDIKIAICTLDDNSEFLKGAKANGFEVYKYKRELVLEKLI